jgi:hypothetical protein
MAMTDMSQTVTAESSSPATTSRNLPSRVIGVIFSPRATYADVAARPRWLGALAVVLLVSMAGTFSFLSTEVGKNAMLDQQVRTMESFGVKMTDQTYDRMEQGVDRARYFGAVAQGITLPLAALLIAAIAFAVFNAAMGCDASFKQVYSIVAHSGVVLVLSQLVGLPLAYARETMAGATNLAVFAPFLDESSFAARLLGSIDLFIIWWAVSLAIGLGVLYKKRTGPIATTLLIFYVAIGVVIAAVKSAVSGA